MRFRKQIYILMLCLMGICAFTGCKKRHSTSKGVLTKRTTTQAKAEQPDTVTGVIVELDLDKKRMVLTEVEGEWRHTLTYDVYTEMKSRYGELIAVSQLEEGEIVDVTLDSEDAKKIKSLKVSYDAWEYEDVKGLTYSQADNTIQVKGETYVYTSNLVVRDNTAASRKEMEIQESASQEDSEMSLTGKKVSDKEASKMMKETDKKNQKEDSATKQTEETMEDADSKQNAELENDSKNQEMQAKSIKLTDISKYDKVTCRGYKGKIYSVTVTAGHGYVRLSDYSTYIGGMVVIGEVMEEVTKDMLLAVPVGEWTLEIDKDGKMGTKQIVVEQNVEQTVNLADLTIVACEKGIFHFVLSPANATITIDDVEYNGRTEFMLEYGVHKVVVSAVDYKSYNGTINLNVPYMNINVELEPLDSDDDSTADTSVTTQTTTTTTASQTTEASTTTQSSETQEATTTQTESTTSEATTDTNNETTTEATTTN